MTLSGNDSTPASNISEFYRNAVIFITGATGFVGKVLIEKLLRTCPSLDTIYVLIRPKRGVQSNLRFKNFLNHDIFKNLMANKPEVFQKLVYVSGDVAKPKLGLNEADYEAILKNVTVVFHSAATVKFNEPLKYAGNLNAYGTWRLMEMCTQMAKLKSFVHVSTAYCNPGRQNVNEVVYPCSSPLDKDCFMKCMDILPEKFVDAIWENMKGPHPNTYTLTKSIAEIIVSEYSERFPVSIVRPSIITGALSEPCPGWVDNIQGITGIIMEIGRGTIKSILGNGDLVCDIIPVDVVVNTMLGAAWRGFVNNDRQTNVYNCTSGQLKTIYWQGLGGLIQKWARVYPSKYTMLYPHFNYTTNRWIHAFYEILYHMLPAYIFDVVAKLQGSKPIMLKMARKLHESCEIGKFFVLNEWIFDNRNQRQLVKEVQAAEDGDKFPCDIAEMDYDEYVKNFMIGIRKFVLRDDEKSLPMARRKLHILFWIRTLFQLGMVPPLVYVSMLCLRIIFN